MNRKEQLNNFRDQLMQVIREAVEKENGCIGTFYKNKGRRYHTSQVTEEYDDGPIVVAHIPDLDTYGGFIAATVFDLYLDTELCMMCALNGEAGEDWDEPLEHIQTEGLQCIADWLRENGFITGQSDNPYRCVECGSTNLQKMAWVRPNKDNVFVDYCGDDSDNGEHWCDDCEEHIEVLTENQLLKDIEQWWKQSGVYAKEEIAGLRLSDYEASEAGKEEFHLNAGEFWAELSIEQKIEKWKTYKKEKT